MIIRFASIRSKVWLCVSIALLGYFVATLLSFYINVSQYQRLSHFQKNHLELVMLGHELQVHIERQAEEFEVAFLIGEQELFVKANEETPKVVKALDRLMQGISAANHDDLIPYLEQLSARYLAFSTTAKTLNVDLTNRDFSIESQREVKQFGQQQHALIADVQQMMEQLNADLIDALASNKQKSVYSILVLAALFLVVLLLVTFVVNRVALRLLVRPLEAIQHNFKAVERGTKLKKPQSVQAGDEIGQLSSSFWDLTQLLKETTVSKRYFENIIGSMSGALVVLSADQLITKINSQSEQLFGYDESELTGKTIDSLLGSDADCARIETCLAKLRKVKEFKDIEVGGVHRSGVTFPAHFSGSALYDDSGSLDGIICVFNDISAIKETENRLVQLAHHDPLTGLPNRNLFFDRLQQTLYDGRRYGRTFALLYLDLDNFKPLNDTLGHEVGDKALCEISARLRRSLRTSDTVARMGGDEFIIILTALTCVTDAQIVAKNIIDVVKEPFVFGHISHTLGISVGISIFPNDGTCADALIAAADRAMYRAKESGGNMFYPIVD